ncbi:uncharacterized protein LOC135343066 isoform X1 [Halichondria panicea]|uniref:uncharacterized protein LOC135343066 isoform X1 n=2 Tax=Halichondria panicea TaxID=6063 RepID=UPI00312BC4C0
MTAEDSPADDRVCLILQAAQYLESPNPDAVAGNNLTAGTSRAVSSVKRKNGCSSQERGAEIDKGGTSMLATFHHEEISDSDIETDGESEEPGLPLSPDSHLISHKKGGKMRANLDSKERGRKGGHGKAKVSIEEMIQKQETASQIHNENERYRRKELRVAVLSLRNQLTRPTKRPAVKLVLEAAIKELKDLKRKEKEDMRTLESLKDKEKRLTIELENKMKEYKSRPNCPSSSGTVLTSVPQVPSPGSFFPPPISGSWFPAVPGNNIPRPIEIPPVSHMNSPPVIFSPWPSHCRFGVPTYFPPPISQSLFPFGNSRFTPLIFQYPLRPTALSMPLTPSHPTFTVHNSFPMMQGMVPQQLPQADESHRMVTIVSPRAQAYPQSSAYAREYSQSEVPLERERTCFTESDLFEAENSRESYSHNNTSSKNGGESADTECRSSSVLHYTTSADSTRKPATLTDRNTILCQEQESFPHDSLLTFNIVHPPPSLHRPITMSTYTNHNKAQRVQKTMPPLLRIDSDSELGIIQKSMQGEKSKIELRAHTKASKFSQIHNSELVTVQYCKNPHYNRISSLKKIMRKRRKTSTSDSETSDEESELLTAYN